MPYNNEDEKKEAIERSMELAYYATAHAKRYWH